MKILNSVSSLWSHIRALLYLLVQKTSLRIIWPLYRKISTSKINPTFWLRKKLVFPHFAPLEIPGSLRSKQKINTKTNLESFSSVAFTQIFTKKFEIFGYIKSSTSIVQFSLCLKYYSGAASMHLPFYGHAHLCTCVYSYVI